MTGVKVCIIAMLLTAFYLITSVLVSNIFFYNNSTGSLIKLNKKTVGSKLIGQEFKNKIYFHGRPSLFNYNNSISGNSNFPFYSTKLRKTIIDNYNDHLKNNYNNKPDINLISESGSGLDPDITYEGALSQIDRIATNAGIKKEKLKELLEKKAKPHILGIFGKKIVNVLELNLGLNEIYAKASRSR